jgi:hypothetical protein
MADTNPFSETAISISKKFSLTGQFSSIESLHRNLSLAICELLLHDYQKLLNLLYLIDVNEKKFQDAFKDGTTEHISDRIATLVIERELQKVELRKKYKS